jgi:DHA3 family tetracycline resistance protein-like MFS transporter
MKRIDAYRLYLILEGASSLFLSMIFAASSVYQVTVAGLSPLQLVLVGTVLEASVFLFEVPTGVVADVFSRRLSVIIGIFLIGLGFILEGSVPLFIAILLAQVLWGVGYTFTSGATQAWITDEIGEEAAGKAFLRSTQVDLLCSLVGLGLGVALGAVRVNLAIQVGGGFMLLLGVFLTFFMPETGFKPAPRGESSSWQNMMRTLRDGLNTVRGRPALMTILGIGLIYGLYSEGFDRLWTKHLIDQFAMPLAHRLQPVVWIGAVRAVGMLFSLGAAELARRNFRTDLYQALARALLGISVVLVIGLFGFAMAGSLFVAIPAYWLIAISRNVIDPLYTAWVNHKLESHVRATVISMSSQVDAIGQIGGGPMVGMIGNLISVRAALLTSAFILSPVIALYSRALRQNEEQPDLLEPVALEDTII